MTWEVGKTYLTRGRFGCNRHTVLVVATDLTGTHVVGGILSGADERTVESWRENGQYNTAYEGPLDLTTDLAP